MRATVLLIAGCALVPGCNGKPTQTISDPAVVDKGPRTSEPAPQLSATQAPTLSVPDALKGPAYEYYGLSNSKPEDYEFLEGDQGIRTGAITFTLKDVKDGKAYFEQVGSGGLDKLGVNEYMLDKSGLHVSKSTLEEVQADNMEFPNDVMPGHSWTSHEKTASGPAVMDLTTTYTIRGVKPVKTKRGVLQGLEITSTSQGTNDGQKIRMETESYYVKGIGLAKQVINMKGPDGKPMTVTQQLAD